MRGCVVTRASIACSLLGIAFAAGCTEDTATGSFAVVKLVPAAPKSGFVLTARDGAPFELRHETDRYLTLLFFG